jgi:hypothetical protein
MEEYFGVAEEIGITKDEIGAVQASVGRSAVPRGETTTTGKSERGP